MALRIEDYALLGNCESAALVGRDRRTFERAWRGPLPTPE